MSVAPTFSIVIPIYNVSEVIEDTLNSVYNQTFTDFEIIAVNDGSTDNTLQILKRQTDKRLIILNKKNGGVSSARNAGILLSKGKYIAFLDADDIWANNHLESAKSFFDNNHDVSWYTANKVVCSMETKELPFALDPRYKLHNFYISGSFYVHSSSVVIRRTALPTGNLFCEKLTFAEDLVAWRNIASRHPSVGVNHTACVAYRMRPDSEIHTRKAPSQATLNHQLALFNCLYESQHSPESGLAGWLNDKEMFTYSWHYAIRGNYLHGFIPIVWQYRKQSGLLAALYVCSYILLNNLLVNSFSWPMRTIRQVYFKLRQIVNK